MEKEIKNMSVSFNLSDPFQKQMKEYADQFPNFSGYIKRLIQRDMEGGMKQKETQKAPRVEVKKTNIKYLTKDIDQNTNQCTNSSTN